MCSVQVDLGVNKLGDEGTEFIAAALKESTTSKLQKLYMDWNSIGSKGAAALAKYVAVSASLTSVSLFTTISDPRVPNHSLQRWLPTPP